MTEFLEVMMLVKLGLNEVRVERQAGRLIEEAGETQKSVVPKGEMVTLKTTADLSTGGTAMDMNDEVHAENVHIAVAAVEGFAVVFSVSISPFGSSDFRV